MLDPIVNLLYRAIYKECYEGQDASSEWAKAIQVWDIYKEVDSVSRTNALDCNLVGFQNKSTRPQDTEKVDCDLAITNEMFYDLSGNACEDFSIGIRFN
jgi:hypothetical protein